MKKLILFVMVVVSAHCFGDTTVLEFDEKQEIKCHAEIKEMGCTDKKGEEMADCVESKKVKLSKECRNIHAARMKNQ